MPGTLPERHPAVERPPRASTAVSPWVEISAWILAFAILLAAQCAPERLVPGVEAAPQAGEPRR